MKGPAQAGLFWLYNPAPFCGWCPVATSQGHPTGLAFPRNHRIFAKADIGALKGLINEHD